MKRIARWTVLAIVLVATVLGAQSAPDKRDVVLDLGLPNGATPQLRITEGETGSIELPNVGKFGFVPAAAVKLPALTFRQLGCSSND